ncbi:MAG: zinc ribbon domain-containing protein [Clostridia bacterium]|nr:zinc ribbon domain-containing protein [Clostridia bacterium]
MSFCSNCGSKLAEGVKFCPNCGFAVPKSVPGTADQAAAEVSEAVHDTETAVENAKEDFSSAAHEAEGGLAEAMREAEKALEAEDPIASTPFAAPAPAAAQKPAPEKKKKRSRAGLVIGIILLALIAAAAALYFTGAYRSLLPASRLKLGLAEKAVVDDVLDRAFSGERTVLETKADTKITASIDTNGGLFSETGMIGTLLDKVVLELNVDTGKNGSNIFARVNYSGNPVVDARLIKDGENIGVYVPQLDEHYYIFNQETLMQALDSSGALGDSISRSTDERTAIDEARIRKEVNELLKIAAGLSTKENTQIERGAEVAIFGGAKTVKAELYTVTPSAEEFEKFVNDVREYLSREDCYIAEVYKNSALSAFITFGDDSAEEIHEACVEMAEQHAKIQVAMIGNEIVSQRLVRDDGTGGLDMMAERGSTRIYAFIDADNSKGSADIVLDTKVADRIKGTGTILFDEEKIDVVFDLDKTKLSALHTPAGTITCTMDGQKILEINSVPDGSDMKSEIVIYPGEDDADLTAIRLTAVISEGSGVEAPKGVEPTDMTNCTPEEIAEIFRDMEESSYSLIQELLFGSLF